MKILLSLIVTGVLVMTVSTKELPTVTVKNEVLNKVDPRLFGQFLERASFGESGPEAAIDENGNLRPDCMALLKRFAPPIIRFPGGTDIDYINWHDMIDNVPGREGGRPLTAGHTGKTITNRFGYDEYFALRDTLKNETIIVLNLLDGLSKKKNLQDAALHAAGLVAYCNAPQGTALPEGMPDWPAVRAANGHPEPFKTEFVQLGNEWFIPRFKDETSAAFTVDGVVDTAALGDWITAVLSACVRAIRAVDKDVQIIMDNRIFHGVAERVQTDPYLRKEVKYLAMHFYMPMSGPDFKKGEEKLELEDLDAEQAYTALSSMPGVYNDAGMNVGYGPQWTQNAVDRGYRLCFTEWNWNGWNFNRVERAAGVPWESAASVGVASFLQGMMGNGAHADFANQSMLLGHGWNIAAVRYKPDVPGSAHFGSQGRTTLFYKEHAGTELVRTEYTGIPLLTQPYTVKHHAPHPAALIEPAATKKDGMLYVHLVHRGYAEPVKVRVNLDGYVYGTKARLHTLTCRPEPLQEGPERILEETGTDVKLKKNTVVLELAPRSVNCLAVELK